MNRLVIVFTTAFALTGNVWAGSIYKCIDAAGNVSFSQTSCPKNSSGGEVDYIEPSKSRTPKGNRNISPHEQLRQIEAQKNKERILGQSSQSRRLHKKRCNYYRKQARRYGNRYRGDEGQEIFWLGKIQRECK